MKRWQFSRWIMLLLVVWVAAAQAGAPAAYAADEINKLVLNKNELVLQVGDTSSLTSTAVFVSGVTENVTVKTDWNSGAADVASVYAGVVTAKKEGKAVITATYMGKTEIINVTVTKKVKSLIMDKQSIVLRLAQTEQVGVTAYYDDGTSEDVTSKADYTISQSSVVSVTNGLVKGQSPGTAIITIKYMNQTLSLPVDVEIVKRVDAEKAQVSLLHNGSEKIKLMATYPDGTVADVSEKAVWTSDKEQVADVIKGTITGYGAGQATITASYGTKSTTIKVDVDNAVKLDLDKQSLFMKKNASAQLKLTATYANGTTEDITERAEWKSSDESIVNVVKGKLIANALGEITVSAKYGEKTVSAIVDVEVPRRLDVDKETVAMQAGTDEQLVLRATYADGTSQEVADQAVWSIDNESIAFVAKGKITAYKAGEASAKAAYGGKTAVTKVEVDIPSQLKLSKKTVTFQVGDSERITLTAVYRDGREEDVTAKAEWTTSAKDVADVSKGTITGADTGAAAVTVKYGTRTAVIQVSVGELKSLTVDQDKLVLRKGNTAQIAATAAYKDNTEKDVSADVVWTSSNPKVASVDAGKVKALAAGESVVSAVLDGKTVSVTVQVDLASELSASPSVLVFDLGETKSITVTAKDLLGAVRDVTNEADWKSSNIGVAQVAKGVVTPVGRGKATITAAYGGKSVSIPVEIGVVQSLEADVRFISAKRGEEVQVSLTAKLSDGTTRDVTGSAAWKTSSYKVADVKNGLLKAVGSGKTTLTASFGGKSVSIPVEIDTLKYLKTDVVKLELKEGKTAQASALATYTDGSEDNVTVPALWTTSNILVADVKDGIIKATGKGSAKITVTYSNLKATIVVTVTK